MVVYTLVNKEGQTLAKNLNNLKIFEFKNSKSLNDVRGFMNLQDAKNFNDLNKLNCEVVKNQY